MIAKNQAVRGTGAGSPYRDFTRYDLQIAGEQFFSQSKRRLIFLVVQRAMTNASATPDDITDLVDRNPWAVAEGLCVDEDTFKRNITEQYAALDRPFDARRWFTGDDELFRSGGKTFAFTKMWSGDDVLRAVENIRGRYLQLGITVTPSVGV